MRLHGPLCLVALASLSLSAAQTYPATVEFDLVFPRNDTYAPVELMPIIFAVQNAKSAGPLRFAVQWSIRATGSRDELDSGLSDLTWANYTTEPYFVASSTILFNTTVFGNGTEGTFVFQWELASGNCSTLTSPIYEHLGGIITYNHTTFTIKHGASPPSLLLGSDTCPTQTATFNLTGTLPVEDPSLYKGLDIAPFFQTRHHFQTLAELRSTRRQQQASQRFSRRQHVPICILHCPPAVLLLPERRALQRG